jgi:alanine dehydrogenase
MQITNKGAQQALIENPHLMNGLNVYQGHITCQAVACAHGLDYMDPAAMMH